MRDRHACVHKHFRTKKIVGITNFSRISSWIPKVYLGDTPNNTPAPLAGLTATEVAEFGGGSWSRTNNVYHEGTDLQSAAEHAISTIPPKFYTTDNSFVQPSLYAPFTLYAKPWLRLGTPLGILNQRILFLLGYCAPRCFTISLAGQLLAIVSFSC